LRSKLAKTPASSNPTPTEWKYLDTTYRLSRGQVVEEVTYLTPAELEQATLHMRDRLDGHFIEAGTKVYPR
jgi:hypothetical protein